MARKRAWGLHGGNPSGLGERVNAGFEQRLIGVNVSEARHQILIHQPALDGAGAAFHRGEKLRFRDALSVGPECRVQFFEFFSIE